MKKWLSIFGAFLIILVVVYGYPQCTTDRLRASVSETRRELRQQGFKTELSDFNFAWPAEINARADAITAAGQALRSVSHAHELQLMEWVGTNVALAISTVEIIETHVATNLWPLVHDELAAHDETLNVICASLLDGPVKFQPVIKPDGNILLPYLADYNRLGRVLASRAVLAMHDHNTNQVFTNLLALSRLVTAWTPEPSEVAHMVRFRCEGIAQQAIWELVQTDHCNEAQLAALQSEWESVRFFDGLPATAELSCAQMIAMCQAARNESYSARIGGWGPVLRGIFSSPGSGFQNLWEAIQEYRRHWSYKNRGSYEDEKALLLYYGARNQELKHAITSSSWSEMRAMPGISNVVRFQGTERSRIGPTMNLKQLTLGFQGRGRSVIGRAAEAEVRRRLIVAGIALKRFVIQRRVYPRSLSDLVPSFLPSVPMDFMDGKELRYRAEDGRFLLYSVGPDCVDNGGTMPTPNARRRTFSDQGTDLVWPLSATQADVDAFERAQKAQEKKRSIDRTDSSRTLED